MRHRRHPDTPSGDFGGDHHHRGRRHRERHHGRRSGRLFDYGDLRLLLLAIIAEQPSHGYELIKNIEERFGGSYSPSPGVIYPTLSWLDDMGYAAIEAEEGGRKRYRITDEGKAFLVANREAIDELFTRTGTGRSNRPTPIVRAMENLKLALRLRLKDGPVDDAMIEAIAATIDAAALEVEKTR